MRIAITTSSSAALPARSPRPLIAHSTWRAPAATPASELATARPRSLWQCVETTNSPSHGVDDVADELGVVLGHAVADGVGDVQRGGAVVDRELAHLAHEVEVGAAAVLGRELDVVAVALGPGDAAGGLGLHLVLGHPQLLLHVDRRRRDEDVDARLASAWRTASHARSTSLNAVRDRPAMIGPCTALAIASTASKSPWLAIGNPASMTSTPRRAELLRDLELLAHVERDARRLLAVPQGRVEDHHVVGHGCSRVQVSVGFGQRKTSPARRHEEASASTGGVLAAT